MKTYFINTLKSIATNNQSLDLISTIKSQEWIVFNEDSSYVEKFLFIDNERLLVSVNGKSSYSKWQYIKVNSSLVIDDEQSKYLLKIVVCNKDIIVLNVDSTNDYSFLINSRSSVLQNPTYKDIQWYLIKNCEIDIFNEEERKQFAEKIEKIKRNVEQRNEEWKDEQNLIIGIISLIVVTLFFIIWSISMR